MFNQMLYVNACSAVVSICGMSPLPALLVNASRSTQLHVKCSQASLHTTLVPKSATLFVIGLVGGGQLWEALSFVSNHPDALLFILLLSLAATLGVKFLLCKHTASQWLQIHCLTSFGCMR